jgi:5S rRNA maturation endonuclease (ribonuclease M5)
MDEELIEDVRKVLKRFSDEAEEGAVVLVEGQRDIEALRMLGYTGTILSLNHLDDWMKANPPPSKIILLMDFDREGWRVLGGLRNASPPTATELTQRAIDG